MQHVQVILKYYNKMNAVKGHDQEIEFKKESIRLDIPFPSTEGITTVNGGWRITAVSTPAVSYFSRNFLRGGVGRSKGVL